MRRTAVSSGSFATLPTSHVAVLDDPVPRRRRSSSVHRHKRCQLRGSTPLTGDPHALSLLIVAPSLLLTATILSKKTTTDRCSSRQSSISLKTENLVLPDAVDSVQRRPPPQPALQKFWTKSTPSKQLLLMRTDLPHCALVIVAAHKSISTAHLTPIPHRALWIKDLSWFSFLPFSPWQKGFAIHARPCAPGEAACPP